MTYKRLSQEEKTAIVAAAGQGETIKNLATKFGVSENTVRRTIKTGEVATPTPPPKSPPKIVKRAKTAEPESETPPEPETTATPELQTSPPRKSITRRKRSSSQSDVPLDPPDGPTQPALASETPPPEPKTEPRESVIPPPTKKSADLTLDDSDDEDEDDLTGLAGADLDDFGDDDFEEEDETDSSDDPDEAAEMLAEDPSPSEIAIFPLEAAVLPRPCYLVIDTRSELLARPLAEFRGLGHAAQEEEQQKTLPIFESRAVALRFSQRNQRIYKNSESILRKTVVKVPDGNVLRKTTPYLQDKGITRLLIHGQVYALE